MSETASKSTSGLAIASLVLGIVAMATSFLPIINNMSFILALIGVVLGIVGIVGIRKGAKGGMGLAVAGTVLSVIAFVVVLATQAMFTAALDSAQEELQSSLDSAQEELQSSLDESTARLDRMTGDATEDILGTDVDVAIEPLKVEEGQYGLTDTGAQVTVTNLMDAPATFNIQLELVDAAGNRVASTYVLVDSLGAGQSTIQEAFTYLTRDELAKIEGGNSVRVVSVSQY